MRILLLGQSVFFFVGGGEREEGGGGERALSWEKVPSFYIPVKNLCQFIVEKICSVQNRT